MYKTEDETFQQKKLLFVKLFTVILFIFFHFQKRYTTV